MAWWTTIAAWLLCCVFPGQPTTATVNAKDGVLYCFTENLKEFHKVPMSYTSSRPVPPWLSGTLVRNAPSQFSVGRRSVVNYFDGFAKLHSLDINQHSVNFSASFLKTGVYNRSIEANDILPGPTFMGVDPPFSLLERLRALSSPGDNAIINVWNFGGDFAALTDAWVFAQFDLDTLDTIGVSVPDPILENRGCQTTEVYMSCAHPMVEPGTGHSINFVMKVSLFPGQRDTFRVIRIKDLRTIETLASFEIDKIWYMHSFSLTENFAIFFAQPCYYDFIRFFTTVEAQHSIYWAPDDGMKIYVVNLKTGNVTTLHTEAAAAIYTHHVNAYETGDGRVVNDVVILTNTKAFTTGLARSRLTNITAIREMQSPTRLFRYILDLKTGKVEVHPFVSKSPTEDFPNTLDLPVINEKCRGRRYCYTYGTVTTFHSNSPVKGAVPIVKKNVCLSHNDTLWSRPNHYAGEPIFVADPNGTEEHDGVILSSVLDGDRGLNYLLILDARTMKEINTAYMPTWIPFGFHGQFFPRSFPDAPVTGTHYEL
ncbi:beta,beta-carotene 15,15'-dioxygenase-like [Branchiostoma floridae]|uniref:Beta,beta-carotene 15,15'-dioxygenase-like n=1 Tax=Branchiostoma floridae TaxID=7739 RepID=A0A9J7ML64_BRAFL|nr:beta,beta-carotene 15,15'-dioxygenase-like [Branchiostoma floridae]